MYYHQLAQENLLVNVQHLEWQETAFNNWTLSDLRSKTFKLGEDTNECIFKYSGPNASTMRIK